MAIQSCSLFSEPTINAFVFNTRPATGQHVLDASGEKFALILQVPEDGTLTAFDFYVNSFTSSGDVDCRIETLDTSVTPAVPSGTLLGTNSNGTVTISGTGWKTATLTQGVSVTRGQWIAVVVAWQSGNYRLEGTQSLSYGVVYGLLYTGSWAASSGMPVFFLKYGSTYYPQISMSGVMNASSYNTGSTWDEIGNLFSPTTTRRCCGFYAALETDAAGDVVLYDSGNNVLASVTLDDRKRVNANLGAFMGLFTSRATLTAGQNYRIVLKPTTASNVAIAWMAVATTAQLVALPGGNFYQYTARANAGAWTETVLQQCLLYPVYDGIETAGGAGIAVLTGGGLVR